MDGFKTWSLTNLGVVESSFLFLLDDAAFMLDLIFFDGDSHPIFSCWTM